MVHVIATFRDEDRTWNETETVWGNILTSLSLFDHSLNALFPNL